MQGIKPITDVLESFTMIPLLSSVQPNWDQSKQCKALPCNKLCGTEYFYFISKTAKHFTINIPHTKQLADILPPFFSTEEVEGKNHKNAGVIEINKCQQANKIPNAHSSYCNQNSFVELFASCFFVPVDQSNRN